VKKLSVICSTYNRADLLDRSLWSYARLSLDPTLWEYLIVDDHSEEDVAGVVRRWADRGLPVACYHAAELSRPKAPGAWVDGSRCRNAAAYSAVGQYVVMTFPEVIIPSWTLESLLFSLESAPEKSWVTTIPYWLPPVPASYWEGWQGTAAQIEALHAMPGFYDPSWPSPLTAPGAVDYRNQNQEQRVDWNSDGVMWAMPMRLFRWMGGFREIDAWGAIDMDFWDRRRVAGIDPYLAKSPKSKHAQQVLMVYHADHGDSPRDLEKAFAALRALPRYTSVQQMREQGGIYSAFYNGPRERAREPGTLKGIMPDHVNRYRWAAEQLKGADTVIDMPCGTGYGAALLGPAVGRYVGVDIDAESVEWATSYLNGARGDVAMVGSLDHVRLPDGFADGVASFEGFEHVGAQAEVVAEFARLLRPGGRLLLSTPQKGATPGTAFDKFMVTHDQLRAFFSGPEWVDHAWYHQPRYGLGEVTDGPPPADAEIQILSVRRG
jgi:SAM-dependent methyltransferase